MGYFSRIKELKKSQPAKILKFLHWVFSSRIKELQNFLMGCFHQELKNYGAPDKPCGVVCADVNPKTVAKRYMIVQKVVSLHYESEWQ